MRISIAILIIALIASLTNAGQPMLPAKKLIFLLLHGEAGKGNSETSKIFTDVKRSIELEYNVEGRVFCYQMENPAGDMDSWIEEISSDSNPTSFMKRAMKECRERIAYETGLTDSIALDAATPKEFVIFAHSFAGLAVRRYICSNEYRGDIRMLITLSTPNEGTEYPHILEILETRTALKRIKSVANKAIKSVDAKGELLKSLETAYELRKAYASVTELIDGVKKLIKEFKEARDRLTEATNALKESANELNPQEIISTIQNTVDAAKTTFQSPPNIDWNALKNLKSIFVDSITAQLKESSVMDLYTLMKDLDSCANGQLASLLSDFNSNRAILENAFSVETFLREFNPEKLKNYGVSTDFSRYY
ncbi:MAG: hypothetical protein JNL74_06845, partial [Fibrobacteres bacterium]|nr:hypothetical protein [Fibrobacterota bacterium]